MFEFISNGEKLKTSKLNLKTGLNEGWSDTVRQTDAIFNARKEVC